MGISSMGSSSRFSQGKPAATESRYPTITNLSACWSFSCFHNPPNSDMDCRIFNVRTSLFVFVRVHTGVGHTGSESAQHFWLGKNSHKFVLCSWRRRDSNIRSLDLESNALPTESPRHPLLMFDVYYCTPCFRCNQNAVNTEFHAMNTQYMNICFLYTFARLCLLLTLYTEFRNTITLFYICEHFGLHVQDEERGSMVRASEF